MRVRAVLKRPVVLLAAIIALATAGGIAWASIPASNGVFTGCYLTTGTLPGRLRVIDPGAGQTCTASEHQITWNAKGINWRGTWSTTVTYAVGDGVNRSGSSYVAIAASTHQAPPNATYWGVLAQRGATGTPGAPAALYFAEHEASGQLPHTLSFAGVPAGTVVLHVEATAYSSSGGRSWITVTPSPGPDTAAQAFRYPTLYFNQTGVHMNLMPMTWEFGWSSAGDRSVTLTAADSNLLTDANDFFTVSMTVYPASEVPLSRPDGPAGKREPGSTP